MGVLCENSDGCFDFMILMIFFFKKKIWGKIQLFN